ncbi:hypothetical protein QN277_004228 [Acacia crassicarpa]|uniref:TIR domain-containing protein n=1 Tax=Acacia crassicarpa TaxID=499986 RepID=A0AAE1J3W0_9FABA|nr:hypothetical protein QN277_004228 [Acacia crassicarpa]
MAPIISRLSSSDGEGTRVLAGSNTAPAEKHEVFISFRGEDTRITFTSHLYAAFRRHDIRTYIDHNLERGDEISATLLGAIEDARLSVIVFSENYADSRWCLDELVKIVECSKKKKQMIVPVFYEVDPSTVREQTGSYAEAFARNEQSFEDNMEKVQLWRHALTEASTDSGFHSSTYRTEHEMVEEIAKMVLEKLGRAYVGDLDLQIEKLEKLAQLQEEFSKAVSSSENERNHQKTLERIERLKTEKEFRELGIPPELLSHMEISPSTGFYF